jgi:hypothetical protein
MCVHKVLFQIWVNCCRNALNVQQVFRDYALGNSQTYDWFMTIGMKKG